MSNYAPLPPPDGFSGNNYPLRGGKGTLYEGGSRVISFINSPLLSNSVVGTETDELFHIVDWMPTLMAWGGVAPGICKTSN